MSAPIILTLIALVALVAAVSYFVAFRRSASADSRAGWSRIAICLLVGSLASLQVATAHTGEAGADIVSFAAALLIGMALMCALLALGHRRVSK